jgi:5-methylcytosine-specific restriction protein A
MPDMPKLLSARGSRTDRRRVYDRERTQNRPWRAWYKTAAWQRRRADQLQSHPLCCRCLAEGVTTEATVANHKRPHRGDWELFMRGELESVCKPHHDSEVQREERAAHDE